jgi:hypothetical protein
MKVTGPGSGAGAVPEDVTGPEKAGQAVEKAGIDGAEGGAPAAPSGIEAGAGVAETAVAGGPPPGVPATHDIAAELRAGTLAPGAAMEKLIDRIVAQQLGPGAPLALRESLRATLQETVETDPMLAAKLRSLGRLQDS